jgi:hypothetical protein
VFFHANRFNPKMLPGAKLADINAGCFLFPEIIIPTVCHIHKKRSAPAPARSGQELAARVAGRLLSCPSATLASIADGGEGRGEEVLSFIESARSTIRGFMGSFDLQNRMHFELLDFMRKRLLPHLRIHGANVTEGKRIQETGITESGHSLG